MQAIYIVSSKPLSKLEPSSTHTHTFRRFRAFFFFVSQDKVNICSKDESLWTETLLLLLAADHRRVATQPKAVASCALLCQRRLQRCYQHRNRG